MRVRGNVGLFAVLCLLPLTPACTNSTDKPSTLPSGATVSATSATATPGDPSTIGAPLIQSYWKAADDAAHGGELTPLRDFYTDACSTCATLFRNISAFRAKGQRVIRADHVVTIVGARMSGSMVSVSATISASPGQLLGPSGQVVHEYGGVPAHDWVFELVEDQTHWRIRSANNLGPS